MKFNSLVDPKKRELVREAIRKKDASLLMREKSKAETIHVSGLEVFIPNEAGATMEEALARVEKEKRVIASNKRLSVALLEKLIGRFPICEWKTIKEVFHCWSGTMTAYEKVGKPFGEVVEYVDDQTNLKYLFIVPQKYIGMKDCILVAEHPDYSLDVKGDARIILAAKVDLIERFPAENGWYVGDAQHDIPNGSAVNDSDDNARYLGRIDTRVGPAARGCGEHSHVTYAGGTRCKNFRRDIDIHSRPSCAFGVAVESPVSGSATKIQK